MKKGLFLTICLFIVSVTAVAQQRGGGGTPEENAKQTTEWMTAELKLTAEQIPQVEAINLSMAKERTQLMQNSGGNMDSAREAMQKLTEKTEEALSKILTNEQLDEYKKQAAQRQGGRGNR